MQSELQALEKNSIWDFVILPPGKKTIGCKWVYKVKLKSDEVLNVTKHVLLPKVTHESMGFIIWKLSLFL